MSRRKNSPSDRARRAKLLVNHIETATSERHEVWADGGDHPNLTEYIANDLAGLHDAKRAMRRDIYSAAPELEGREYRGRTAKAGRG